MSENFKGTCFVVMGFGKKTDYANQRVLDLDKSYHNMIKPAVEAAGLKCIRADEIQHSGSIDEKMYRQLLTADVVVADLSTSNANAFYELGVRHALRPYTTIIVADEKMQYPFDVNHIAIRQYRHLGDDIGYSEVVRFQKDLKEAIGAVLNNHPQPENDSPVYQFLSGLKGPELIEKELEQAKEEAPPEAKDVGDAQGAHASLSLLMRQADEMISNAKSARDFLPARFKLEEARALEEARLQKARELEKERGQSGTVASMDPHIIQRLALATYKSKYPSEPEALKEAHDLLLPLRPETSTNPETLGLWGAVHKRLWNETGERAHLDESIRSYERGFYMGRDYYNASNLAFLLNVRAARRENAAEAIADFVLARRVRREVITICEQTLEEMEEPDAEVADEAVVDKCRERKYWVLATIAEAYFGLGQEDEAERTLAGAREVAPADWMVESTEAQLKTLRPLLADSPLKHINTAAA